MRPPRPGDELAPSSLAALGEPEAIGQSPFVTWVDSVGPFSCTYSALDGTAFVAGKYLFSNLFISC